MSVVVALDFGFSEAPTGHWPWTWWAAFLVVQWIVAQAATQLCLTQTCYYLLLYPFVAGIDCFVEEMAAARSAWLKKGLALELPEVRRFLAAEAYRQP
jgi:hypothetical protein